MIDMAITHITKDNFEAEVLQAKEPVLVDFWATWCGPCQEMGALLEEIAEERPDIKICKIDVDENPELARKYRVFSIPTLNVFKNGEVTARTVGVQSKEYILGML